MKKANQKVVITTQEENQANRFTDLLENRGFNVVNYPMIRIESVQINDEIKKQFDSINDFTWLIFTSRSGVKAFIKLWNQYKNEIPDLSANKIATIGHATAKVLEENDIKVDFVNPGTTSNEFMYYIDKDDVITNMDSILLILGNLALDSLRLKLREITSKVERIDVYQTSYVKKVYTELDKAIVSDNYSLLVFTSPSEFDNFLRHCEKNIKDKTKLRIASIGKTTSRFIQLKGYPIALTSPKSTIEDLAELVAEYIKN
ncbi:MAG: uroporphyrinogen-III synthase [Bacteroidales bacterium]|nr:uroporphyrinogen-III synthase [Bacteroidales bacterium]